MLMLERSKNERFREKWENVRPERSFFERSGLNFLKFKDKTTAAARVSRGL